MLNRRALEKAVGSIESLRSQPQTGTIEGKRELNFQSKQFARGKDTDSDFVMGFVRIDEGCTSADLEETGFNILAVRGDVVIVSLLAFEVLVLAKRSGVKKLSQECKMSAKLYLARASTGVDAIHYGKDGLDVPYISQGILGLILDQGIDPNHVAFIDEKDQILIHVQNGEAVKVGK